MKKIRPIAICVFKNNGKILAAEKYDYVKKQQFYRPLGGGIEFYEPSIDAVKREIKEEMNQDIENIELLGVLENIFVNDGEPGHEIVFVFDATCTNRNIYHQEIINGIEANGKPIKAVWKDLNDFKNEQSILYPDGLLELLEKKS